MEWSITMNRASLSINDITRDEMKLVLISKKDEALNKVLIHSNLFVEFFRVSAVLWHSADAFFKDCFGYRRILLNKRIVMQWLSKAFRFHTRTSTVVATLDILSSGFVEEEEKQK